MRIQQQTLLLTIATILLSTPIICQEGFIKEINLLGQGYNIYKGNPRPLSGLDPGFMNFIINPASEQDQGISYQKVKFNGNVVQSTISSIQSYQAYLKDLISCDGEEELPTASFAASQDYKKTKEDILKYGRENFLLSNETIVYDIQQINEAPKLSQQFIELMQKLEATDDSNSKDFYKAFDFIGTHVVVSMHLGSINYTIYSSSSDARRQISDTDFEKLLHKAYENKESIKRHAIDGVDSQICWKNQNEFPTFRSTTKRRILQSELIPLSITLRNLTQVISRVPADEIQLSNSEKFIERLDNHLKSYCEEHLKKMELVSTCQKEDIQIKLKPKFLDEFIGQKLILTHFQTQKSLTLSTERRLGLNGQHLSPLQQGFSIGLQLLNPLTSPSDLLSHKENIIRAEIYRGRLSEQWELVKYESPNNGDVDLFQIKNVFSQMCIEAFPVRSPHFRLLQNECLPSSHEDFQDQLFEIQVNHETLQKISIKNYQNKKFLYVDDKFSFLNMENEINDQDDKRHVFRLALAF